ncbi:putative transcription factor AS2-LOB family [Helianthus annuus]|uniref:Putative LOB domain-containing protein n=1 Tax=Helianthus annuus TaxID=4232 RepID=A0A251V340_HELAN|nr:LOB domain-containing protein 38 [Helianthus annuus]KAF5812421.1 putative transcription factor AS2-LOB family [Helianthus annuus]KAJ0582979.1 putative transcription factor AS2-LOB family [Helianthus annuus]KAJ0598964.1 putative transcription factor AS2-LOB family [Helianthus annuus]KAJ0763202.1 putative transcription factor AS2-LOB family [Helianthus annuus]KAJ0929176.1 putative transcription factor AS2-LOB family [Helianthus annuus]
MSCNGCRVLRKGCNENCILRQSLAAIQDTPQAQANATLFVAKFFGRATLMSFLSAVPQHQRPALFQSLLLEACGRTVNPVNGAVGLLWTGNWHVCESAVETVLRGGTIQAMSNAAPQDHQLGLTNVKEETRIGNASESATHSASSETKLVYFF